MRSGSADFSGYYIQCVQNDAETKSVIFKILKMEWGTIPRIDYNYNNCPFL